MTIPFHRLLEVEARKLFDTRSGMVMTVLLSAVTIVSIIGRGLVDGPHLETLIRTAGMGLGILLPVLGILTVTGEWHHRTALTTFTLEPRRHRVLAAKCLPPVVVAIAASLLAMVVAVPVTAAVARLGGVPPVWDVAPLALAGWVAAGVLVVMSGLAVGMALLHAPAAIVICLSSTMVWSAIAQLSPTGERLAGWLHLGATSAPLTAAAMSGGDIARLGVSVLAWIVLPMAVGVVRVLRREIG